MIRMAKSIKLKGTARLLKEYLERLLNNQHQIVYMLEKRFPLRSVNNNMEEQENDFDVVCKSLGYDGFIKDDYGIVFLIPLKREVEQSIVDNIDTNEAHGFGKALLLAILSTLMLIVTVVTFFLNRKLSLVPLIGGFAFTALGDFLLPKKNTDKNNKLFTQLNSYYAEAQQLRQKTIKNLPSINETAIDRDKEEPLNTFIKPVHSNNNKNNDNLQQDCSNTKILTDTDDDHFWRNMFLYDQITDAVDNHENYQKDNDWNGDSDSNCDSNNDWDSDNHDDHHDDFWNDSGFGGFDDFGGGSDWGGGGDFGGSDW